MAICTSGTVVESRPFALVFDQPQGAGVRRGEVDAGQADIGADERLPQRAAAGLDQRVDVLGIGRVGNMPLEQRGDVALGLVDRRHHDMRRLLARQLDDVLAHVRLDAVHAALGQVMVQLDLLAGHRLALDHAPGLPCCRDAVDDAVGLVGGLGPVDLHTGGAELLLQLHQQVRQVGERMLAYRFAQIAQPLQFIGVGKLRLPLALQEVHRAAKALAQFGIVQRLARARLEVLRRDEMQRALAHCTASLLSMSSLSMSSLSMSPTMTTHSRRGPCAP